MSTDDDLWVLANAGTDREWHDATGACGGCGRDDCHTGPCLDLCVACVERMDQGLVPRTTT